MTKQGLAELITRGKRKFQRTFFPTRAILQHVEFNVTRRCNLRCQMCAIYGKTGVSSTVKKGDELSLDEIKRVFSEFTSSIQTMTLNGGEPFIREDLCDIIAAAQAKGISPSLITNGTLIDEELAKRLCRFDMRFIQFSLDGPEQVNDRIRGVPGAFRKTVNAIKLVRRHERKNLSLRINCTIQKDNVQYLKDMVPLAEECGVDLKLAHLVFVHAAVIRKQHEIMQTYLLSDHRDRLYGLGLDESLYEMDVDFLIDTMTELQARKSAIQISFTPSMDAEQVRQYYSKKEFIVGERCVAPFREVHIDSNGEVCPCFIDYPAGNLRSKSLSQLYNNARMRRFRALYDKIGFFPICSRCCRNVFRLGNGIIVGKPPGPG